MVNDIICIDKLRKILLTINEMRALFGVLIFYCYICQTINRKDMENKNWIYFGVFIDTLSKTNNLIALRTHNITVPKDWKMFNHHMTIAFNNGSEGSKSLYNYYQIYLEDSSMKNPFVSLVVDGIGISDEAIALRVKWNLPIANKIPHITIATPQNGKPVNSNKITQWIDIEPYQITGMLQVFSK